MPPDPATPIPLAPAGAPRPEAVPEVSVVVPVRNEAPNILPLISEIRAALTGRAAFEIVYVDDGSDDGTAGELARARDLHRDVRSLRHAECIGQSAAIATGVRAARGAVIVTLDGDGQNDPADIPRLLAALGEGAGEPVAPGSRRIGMVAGQRVKRRDTWVRRQSSRVANAVRRRLLRDDTPDTGCGLKAFRRDAFLALPYFDHMHRFLPALMRRHGYAVVQIPVGHRPRLRGTSKYGLHDRLWVGIVDLLGVMWLQRRCRRASRIVEEE